jgi:hypothetical protein
MKFMKDKTLILIGVYLNWTVNERNAKETEQVRA